MLVDKGVAMREGIATAGDIWHGRHIDGELSLAQLKKAVNGNTPVFDWAIGWHARTKF